jgi:tetratricopeptide (TPR) repeat protein
MSMTDNLTEIIDRIKSGNHDEMDIRAISDAFYKGKISLISGDRAVGVSGNVISSQVITGDGNVIFTGADAEAIQSILSSLNLTEQTISKPHKFTYSGVVKFVGRDKELDVIHSLFQEHEMSAIVGMGGIGKTELAIQYALNFQKFYQGGICWFDLRKNVDLGIQIVEYARTLNLNPPEKLDLIGQVAYCWQQWSTGDFLVILDDVIDYKSIKPFLPPVNSSFKVLLTSRIRLGSSIKQLSVDVLDETSALALLESLMGEEERLKQEPETAKSLCNWLGHLPLGLETVGRYLGQKLDLSLEKMLQRLNSKRLAAKALCKNEGNDDMTATLGVASAFELSWDAIGEAKELGCLLGLFAPAPIPWSLVVLCESDRDLEELEDLRDEKLISFNLLQRIAPETYRLHPLIREFFQMKMAESELSENLKVRYCQVMVNIAEEIPEYATQTLILQMQPKIPHIDEAATSWSNYLGNEQLIKPFQGLGRFYQELGFYDEAENWGKRCYAIVQNKLGRENISAATSLSQLAYVYRRQGKYQEAERLNKNALELRKKLLGEEHPDVADSLNNLALVYYEKGEYNDAEALLVQSLEMRRKLLSAEHIDIADSLNNLALTYNAQGFYKEAESLYQEAYKLNQKLLGLEHPKTAINLNNLASCYYSQKQYVESESYSRKALIIFRKLLGIQHHDLATALNNLAQSNSKLKNYKEAEALFLEALEIQKRILGDKHPDIATGIDNLAGLYEDTGYIEKAEACYKEALEMRNELLGNDHLSVGISSNNLAKLYFNQKRYDEAKSLYLDALKILTNKLQTGHPIVQKVKANSMENQSAMEDSSK